MMILRIQDQHPRSTRNRKKQPPKRRRRRQRMKTRTTMMFSKMPTMVQSQRKRNLEEMPTRRFALIAGLEVCSLELLTLSIQLTQLEHILKRPDTYIGSVERTEKQMWVFNSATNSMEWKTINMVPGLLKILDEILVNAADNKIRDPKMDTLKVTVDKESNTVSVFNNGCGIPIEMHSVCCPRTPSDIVVSSS